MRAAFHAESAHTLNTIVTQRNLCSFGHYLYCRGPLTAAVVVVSVLLNPTSGRPAEGSGSQDYPDHVQTFSGLGHHRC